MTKSTRASKVPEQTIMTGVVTEDEIFRSMMKKIGKRGGLRNSPAQQAHRKAVMAEVNKRRKEKNSA